MCIESQSWHRLSLFDIEIKIIAQFCTSHLLWFSLEQSHCRGIPLWLWEQIYTSIYRATQIIANLIKLNIRAVKVENKNVIDWVVGGQGVGGKWKGGVDEWVAEEQPKKGGRKDKKVKSYKMQGNRARGCYLLTMIHLNKLRNHDILRQPVGQIKRRFHGKPTRHCGNLAKPETFNIYLTNCSALLNLHKLKSDTTIAA